MVFTNIGGGKKKKIKQTNVYIKGKIKSKIYTKICHKLNRPYYFSSSLYSLVVVNAISSLGYDIDINDRKLNLHCITIY